MGEPIRSFPEWIERHETLANTIRRYRDKVCISEYVLQEFLKDCEVIGIEQQFDDIDAGVPYSRARRRAESVSD